jgi:hypothetical protein
MKKILRMVGIASALVILLVISIAAVAMAAGPGPNPDCPNPDCPNICPNPDCSGGGDQFQSQKGPQYSQGSALKYQYRACQ